MKKVYLFDIDEEKGKGCFNISQVLEPAIEIDFVAFSKEDDESFKFSIDEEKMRVFGPILVPNKEMFRKNLNDGKGGYAKFTPEAIERIRSSYKKNNNNFAININHQENKAPSYLLEDWIIESDQDKSSMFNLSLDKGSWVGGMQITDKDYWEKMIKTGKVKGFSVEIDSASMKIKEDFNMEKNEIKEIETPEIVAEVEIAPVAEVKPEVVELNEEKKDDVKLAEDMIEVKPDEIKVEEKWMTKEEAAKTFSDIMSRLEKLELELGKKDEMVEQLSKELDETRSNLPGGKSFIFNKDKKVINKEDLPFSQRMKERVFSQNN